MGCLFWPTFIRPVKDFCVRNDARDKTELIAAAVYVSFLFFLSVVVRVSKYLSTVGLTSRSVGIAW